MPAKYLNNSRKNLPARHLSSSIIMVLLSLLLAATGLLFLRLRNGVQIRPSQDQDILPVTEIICYRQDDARWGKDMLGNSNYTLSSSGCLVSCIASALSMERGMEETPGTLNQKFSSGEIYDAEGNLLWENLRKLGSYQVDVYPEVSSDLIDSCLSAGRYPIIRVRNHILGSFHYVLILGVCDGDYLCMDPLQDETVPLSSYGRRVYGIRCVSDITAPKS